MGLSKYNKKTKTWSHDTHQPCKENSISDNAVLAMTEGKEGDIGVGAQVVRLNRFDPKANAMKLYFSSETMASALKASTTKVVRTV